MTARTPAKADRIQKTLALVAASALLALAGCGRTAAPGAGNSASGTASANPPANSKYTPRLTARFEAGEIFDYHATASLDSTMRVLVYQVQAASAAPADGNGTAPGATDQPQVTERVVDQNHESYLMDFSANGTAKAVYPNGTLREVAYLVRRCEALYEDGHREILAPPGTVLGVRKQDDGRLAFALDGKLADSATANKLSLVVQMGNPQETDDNLLGPPAPVAPGDSWPVNEQALLQSGYAAAYPGTVRAVGKFQLENVLPDDQGHLLSIVSGTFALQGMHPPFPPQVEPLPSVVNFQMSVTAPLVPGPGRNEVELKTLIHHEGRTGSLQDAAQTETHFDINIVVDQHANYHVTPGQTMPPALVDSPPVPELPPPAPNAEMNGAPLVKPPGAEQPAAP